MRPATASPTKSNLKRPDYRVIDDGSKKPVQTDSDDYSHSILVREPTLAKSSTLSRKESFKKTPQTLSDPKDSVRFQNFDVEEQESSNMKDEHGDFSSSDPDVSIPGYSYNPNSVNDNLPESPSFPRSRFRSAFPVRGAFNHIGFLKHQNYMLSNKGFVTKRLEKIMKTKSLKNLTEIDDAPLSRNSNGKLAGVTTRSENNISNVGKKGGSPNFSLTRGNSSSKGPAGGPLFEITKKKSRLAYRDKLIKDLQDIQRKLNVLEDRASQMQEDQNNPQGEVDEVVLSTNMIQITEDILEALVSINQRLETLDPSKMAKQSFEGIIRPIMTLLKVAPYNLEILKESATMFMKMSILNEESWAHMFQLKALQHFVDAMIHVKVDDNAVRRRKGGSRSSGNMPITRSLSSSSNNNNPVSNQPSAQSLTATASKVIATMRASMHNSSRQSVMASQGFSRPSLQVSDTQRPSQLGKSLTNIASSMSAILQSNDALGSDNRSSHGMTKGSIMNIISTNTTTPKPRRGSIMNPVNFMNKMMETSNSKFGDLFFTEDNLLSGLLKMYLESNFMDRLEDMGKEERIETIKNLLLSFRKVGKLLSAANYISVELNMNNALEKVLSESCNIIESDKGILWFVDKTTFELRPLSTSSSPRPFEVIPRAVGIAGQVVISKEVIVEENASKSPYFDERVDTYPGKKTRNILAVPIVNKAGQVEAVLELINKKNDQSFTDEDIFLIKHMAIHSGIIIENAKSYDTIRRTQKKVEVLLGTTRSLSSELELEKLIQAIMQAARELLNCDRCTLFLIDREKNELWSQVQGREGLQNIRFPVGVGIAGHVAQTGALVNIADAYKDPRFNPEIDKRTGYKTHSILCMPLKNISGQIIGVTQMINKLSGEFGSDDEQLLAAFSAQAAVAIEKSYLFKKTEEMRNHLENILRSITDSVLTISEQGLMTSLNHTWFLEALGKTDEELRSTNYTLWLGENNPTFAKDVETVFKTHEMIHCTEYDLKTQSNTVTTVNYSVMPLVGGSSGGVVLVLEDLSREKRIMNTLGRYMAPELAKQVLAGGSQLGGTRQKVSIFFSDIRSFTKISEAMQPHEVVELLNRHFEDAVNAIQAEQGVLDKFIGDCVMAVFGVPFVRPDDAIHACNCALRIMKGLAIMNMEREKQGQLQIKIGVGINTGEVLSGNIGSEKRMEYTVIGDNVNLASRVEGLTKYYGVEILITESTKEEVGENFLLREIDTVVVVGKSTGISLYELIGSADYVIDNSRKKCHGIFKTALAEYRKRNFIKAKELFERANDVFPDDKASLVFRDRCQEYIESPPPEDWNGIYVSDHK